MRKLLSGMLITGIMVIMMSMTVFASSYIPSPTVPGDEYFDDKDKDKDKDKDNEKPDDLPGDEHMRDRSPKTGDDRVILYAMAMTAIAAAGTVVIARQRETY